MRAIAYYGAAAGIAASIGLVAGGLLAELVSWRAGFLINLPIGGALIWATLRMINEPPVQPRGSLDMAGAFSSTLGMGALVYGAIRAAEFGWADPLTGAALIFGLVVLALFLRIERRAPKRIMPQRLFADAERVTAYTGRALFLGGMISFFIFLTIYLQEILLYSPALAGLAFLPAMAFNFGTALMVPRLADRMGNLQVLVAGLVIAVIGVTWLSQADLSEGFWLSLGLPSILVGAGQGLSLSPLTAAGIARVDAVDAGAASGLVNASQQLGSSLGLGLTTAMAATRAGSLTGDELLMHRYHWGLGAAAVILVAALILAIRLTLTNTFNLKGEPQ